MEIKGKIKKKKKKTLTEGESISTQERPMPLHYPQSAMLLPLSSLSKITLSYFF